MARYYGYARVSTENQHDTSIQVQLDFLRKRAAELGLEFIEVQEKKSGAKFGDRAEFNRIINESKSSDIIGVYDVSRFGRETGSNIDYIETLQQKDVQLDSNGRIIDYNNPSDKMMFALNSVFATYQRDIQRDKSLKGIKQKKENGDWILRGDLFGYDLSYSKGKPIITVNETEAHYIRLIYEEYSRGRSILSLSEEYKNHVFKDTSFSLTVSSISRILFKPIYMGYYTAHSLEDFDTSSKKARGYTRIARTPRNELEKDLVKSNYYAPIVSEELWWKVHETYRFLNRKHATQYAYRSTPYELTGIIKTSCCNMGFVHWNSKRGYIGELYKNARHRDNCTERIYKGVRKDIAECIMRMSFYITFTDYRCGRFFEEKRAHYEKMIEDSIDYRKTVESRLKDAQKSKENLISYIERFGADESIYKKIQTINEEMISLNAEIKSLDDSRSALDDDIAEYAKISGEEIIEAFINAPTAEVRRNMYARYCTVSMSRDTMAIRYENGMEYTVLWHKYRYTPNHPMSFTVSFRGEEVYEGTIEPIEKMISFKHMEETDGFRKQANAIADRKAIEIMSLLNRTQNITRSELISVSD